MSRNLKLLIVLIVIGTIAGYVIFVTIPTEMARRSYAGAKTLGAEIREAFQFTPEIKVNNTVVLNQQTSAFELAVLQQNFEHRYTWSNSWLGSTKRIFISGTFKAKVGFDLRRKFSITLRDDNAYVTLPQPSTLSVESLGDITYRDEQGIWNWVDMEDRTRATNAFIADARQFAAGADFVDDAKGEMEMKLRELLDPYAENIIINYEANRQRTNDR
ncbi:MAG TPA: DUF4230 domain-containing protein [Chryseosolibacter sp.]|nr:DUF4230 domain-containing protein [Chryseosolibacter sp.]